MEGGDMEEKSSSDMASSEAYTITVLKSDIPSPRKEMKASIGDATITVNYGSPSVKGRNLWGGLVPYDQVWRAGANEATTFEVSKDVTIGGQTLAAGKYGFFLYPKEDGEWEVIFNEVSDQWGAYDYDKSKDVIRVMASPAMVNDSSETMDFMVEGNNLVLRWGKLKLPVAITA
ncbi:hypothetical protein CRP01_03375 [Flavilitoribacter nigricans DSM 23189 = NBRC 102662]|uniref:DUF2911 domain-containing protein n=2 Tax=Flavilitoribacter TaxID=2762562 RepID=A0A2D0NIS9_FLAN2|nr:hypothetical protein CRP01_03375 [Flavilitoribacter nigricans DSM 23189 = NBRC 102662]